MESWWAGLDLVQKIFWGVALPSSAIFLVQTVLTFLGMDGDGGADADFSGDLDTTGGEMPFQLFTFRNFINFFLGLGWGGIVFYPVLGAVGATLIGTLAGLVLVILILLIFRSLSRMTQSGNLDMKNALNREGQVYLTIPGTRSGTGKVHIVVQGSLRELDAVTDGERIATGTLIRVVEVINNKLLLVEKR